MVVINHRRLADLSWSDIEGLVGTEESADLEFKSDLHVPNGSGPHRWHKGEDIDRPAKGAIAKEIVAFANAWGGTLVIGANEDKDASPPICCGTSPLPKVIELAEKLEASLYGMIDPPLSGFECRPVLSPANDGSGVVVMRVGRSQLAPHGFGEPPLAYVRRGAVAAPMTMQDLQNVFWEARTRSERIDDARKSASSYLNEAAHRAALHLRCGVPWPNPQRGLYFRFCLYPQSSLELTDLDSRNAWTQALRPEGRTLFEKLPDFPAGDGRVGWRPKPIAHGIEVLDQAPARWTIVDNGSIEVFGHREAAASRTEPGVYNINPSWLIAPAAQALAMAEALRRKAGRPGVPFEIDAEFIGFNSFAHSRINDWEAESSLLDGIAVKIGPFIYGRENTFDHVYASVERELWHAVGLAHIKPIPIKSAAAVTELLRLWRGV